MTKTSMELLATFTLLAGLIAVFSACKPKEGPIDKGITKNAQGIALDGYDTVAYFVDNKARRGSNAFSTQRKDATWLFVNADHRTLFISNPENYVPQYGGHCALGISFGGFAPGSPTNWQVINGKLYLNTNLLASFAWKLFPSRIQAADQVWYGSTQ